MTPDPAPEARRSSPPRAPGRVRRAASAVAAALGLTLTFAGAAAVGVALHLDTPAARRVARDATNRLLGSLFQGRIVADEIDALSLSGVRIRSAVALDPRGNKVIRASGLEARADVLPMLRGALFGAGPLRIEIPYIRVEQADVLVQDNGAGGVTLGDTFTPLPPRSPPSSAPGGPPRDVVVALSHVEIGRGWVHGQAAPPRALDADVSRLFGSVHVGPEGVAVDVDQTGLVDRAFLPARTAGTANYHLRAGDKVRMWSSFAGRLADVEVTARAVLDEEHLEAQASVPRATPEQLRSLLPDHPLTEPISARVAVNGHLPQLDVVASASADAAGPAGGGLALTGRLDVAGPVRLDAEVQARDVDLRLFGVRLSPDAASGAAPTQTGAAPVPAGAAQTQKGTAPVPAAPTLPRGVRALPRLAPALPRVAPARAAAAKPAPERGSGPADAAPLLTADGRVRVELGDLLRLSVEARTEPTTLLGQRVPAADVHLVLDRGELDARVHLHEPGAPIDAAVSLLPGGQGLRFAATADIPAIAAAPRLAGSVDGAGRVRVEGSLRAGALDARVEGAFAGLRAGPDVALASARVAGRVSGPIDALSIDASLSGKEALAGGHTLDEVTAQISGPLASPKLRATITDGDDSLSASARLSSTPLALRDVELQLKRDGAAVAGKIKAISPSAGGLAVEGLDLSSAELGSLKGRLAVRGDDVTGRLRGDGIDVGRVARMLGIPLRVRGRAEVDVALDRDRERGRSGHVRLGLTGGEIAFLSGISAELTATFERDQVKADGSVRIDAKSPQPNGNGGQPPNGAWNGALPRCAGTLASVRVSGAEGTLDGPLLRAETWTTLVGKAEVAADDWDLGCLAQLMPIGHIVSEVRGKLTTRFRVSRAAGEPLPSLNDVLVRTHGLALAGPHRLDAERPAWESRFVDAQLKGSFSGATGRADAALTLYDGGLLADVSGTIDLDLEALTGPLADRWSSLLRSPIAAHASIPRRAMDQLATLPSFVREALPPLAGEVRIDAYASGTIERPFLTARTLWWGFTYAPPGASDATDLLFPTDLDAWLTYDSERATLDAHVTRGAAEIATVSAEVLAPLERLLGGVPARARKGAPPPPAWTGSFRATLREVPLGEIPLLADSGIAGRVSGEIEMRGLNIAPSLKARLTVPGVTLGNDLAFERGVLALRIDPMREAGRGNLRVTELALEGRRGGKIRANAFASVRFRDGFIPVLDGERTDLALSAERFRLAALQPLVGGLLSKVDGMLDGNLRIELGGPSDADGNLRAQLQVTDGVVHIPELGQELRDVAARITAEGGVLRIEGFRAAGTTGMAQGWALFRLAGLALRDGAGALTIAEDQALPLTLEGVPLGTASGALSFIAEKKPGELALYVTVPEVPTLRVSLPATSSRDVQPLDDNPDISVSHPLGPEKQRRAADALRYTVTFDVRDAFVSGAGLRLRLRGAEDAPPRVVIGEDTRVSGGIEVTRGELEIYGKAFEIEGGRVRLREEEASNPHLNVTAHWDAPDGTRIHVDFNGNLRPITDRSLRFTSSPPSSQQDILARLLFGADFSEGAQAAGAETPAGLAAGGVAASVGSEIAAAQFNALLSGIAPLRGLTTRFGTTSEGTLRTSVVYRLSDNLTAQATFQEGAQQSASAASSGPTPGGTASERGTRTEVTIDWRFNEHWTLRGTVGVDERQTTSGMLDLLWQYRY
ncbi:translocation/assembly module TamB domain-containing protein [Sorangium sp. So ce124]|uniref:translocation/assembly module TamB domain-containing protein n=1 Tax=Sorangium sp. So ce124 TaxID=3133280 RepID=UPI003F5DEFA2